MDLFVQSLFHIFGESLGTLIWTLIKIIAILLPLMGVVAYLTLAERKVIGWMQIRVGPNRAGFLALLQPLADATKLMFKEIIIPSAVRNKTLYLLGPVFALAPALVAWAVIPLGDGLVLANVNAGVLLLLTITSIEIYGIIIAGWASNSKYPFLGAMRASAQTISYEVAQGFALMCVLLVTGSLNLTDIVLEQGKGIFHDMGLTFLSWNWLPLLPMFVVFHICGIAESNRAPFDVVEGESEIVAGHMMEYTGMGFAIFFLGEYANMTLISTITSILFLGGWLSPVSFLPDSFWWLALKVACLLFFYLWIRATFPRFRYDQIMRLGWKVFVPLTLVWLVVVSVWMISPLSIWK